MVNVKEWFKIWKDPVWSKVIASCIIGFGIFSSGWIGNTFSNGWILSMLAKASSAIMVFLFYKVAVIWIIIFPIIFTIFYFVYHTKIKKSKGLLFSYQSYKEDIIDNHNYIWNYKFDPEFFTFKVNDISLLCPKCHTETKDLGHTLYCPRCKLKIDSTKLKSKDDIYAIIDDNIRRKYNKK